MAKSGSCREDKLSAKRGIMRRDAGNLCPKLIPPFLENINGESQRRAQQAYFIIQKLSGSDLAVLYKDGL